MPHSSGVAEAALKPGGVAETALAIRGHAQRRASEVEQRRASEAEKFFAEVYAQRRASANEKFFLLDYADGAEQLLV